MDGSKLAGAGLATRDAPSTRACRRPSPGTATNPDWVDGARSGDWDSYYARQYGARLAAGRAVDEAA